MSADEFPISQDITINQGATWVSLVRYKTGATVATATAVDLSSYVGRMHLKPSYGTAEPTIALTTENERITMNNQGLITRTLSATETAALPAGRYVYDFEIESPDGTVIRFYEGIATVPPEVTKD